MTIWISDAFGQRLHLEIDEEDCQLLLDLNEAKIGELFGHLRKYVAWKKDVKRIRTRKLLKVKEKVDAVAQYKYDVEVLNK